VNVVLNGADSRARARLAGLLGAGSAALLGAAVRWAHHWGVVADSLVAAWALTTIGALAMSVWPLRTGSAGQRLAAGINAAGACGGG
jgi:hypothetical protein